MPCRPSRSVRPPPRPQGVFDLTQARLATNFRRRSIPPPVILYEPRTPDLTQSHECKHTWDSRVGVWHGHHTSYTPPDPGSRGLYPVVIHARYRSSGRGPIGSRRWAWRSVSIRGGATLLLLGCVLLLRLGTLLLLRLGTLLLLLIDGLLLLLRTFPTEVTS